MPLTPINPAAGGVPAMARSACATTDRNRRQRQLVAASLIAVPAVKRPTHRRWA
jgi:hypothetical protein